MIDESLLSWQSRAIKAEAEVARLRSVDSRLAIKHQKLHEEQQSEINRLLLACETMQEQGRQYQESNAALQAMLDNAIDTAFDLEAENARLRKVMNDVINIALNGDAEEWLALREVLAEVDISKMETTMGEG